MPWIVPHCPRYQMWKQCKGIHRRRRCYRPQTAYARAKRQSGVRYAAGLVKERCADSTAAMNLVFCVAVTRPHANSRRMAMPAHLVQMRQSLGSHCLTAAGVSAWGVEAISLQQQIST